MLPGYHPLQVPLEKYADILDVLQLPRWPEALARLTLDKQRQVAGTLVERVLQKGVKITEVAQADMLLTQVRPLLVDDPSEDKDEDDAKVEFDSDTVEELSPVACLMQIFYNDETDAMCRILNTAHRHATAVASPRSIFTLVPLAFACLGLVRKIKLRVDAGEEVEVGCLKLLTFVGHMVESLKQYAPAAALRLHLQCALVADSVGEGEAAYDLIAKNFEVYEEDISDSRAQLAAVTLAAGTLQQMSSFDEDTYETLATKTTQYSAKLLKKPDQCRAVCRASYMFWSKAGEEPFRNAKRVLECLQRALKIADACKANNAHVGLFVEILDAYLYHFEQVRGSTSEATLTRGYHGDRISEAVLTPWLYTIPTMATPYTDLPLPLRAGERAGRAQLHHLAHPAHRAAAGRRAGHRADRGGARALPEHAARPRREEGEERALPGDRAVTLEMSGDRAVISL